MNNLQYIKWALEVHNQEYQSEKGLLSSPLLPMYSQNITRDGTLYGLPVLRTSSGSAPQSSNQPTGHLRAEDLCFIASRYNVIPPLSRNNLYKESFNKSFNIIVGAAGIGV